jgi:exodeoxyribonuclease VII large subunit
MSETQDAAPAPGNLVELTVSELSAAIRRTVEDGFALVRLRGEVSGYTGPHSSGHCYFSLKDENARIDALIWRSAFGRLKFKPEEGMEVIATGRVTTYAGRSTYQIVIERLEPAGVGALMALVEERRRKLAAEGLFDEARKRPLPFLPRVIGVVTSPTGAVIRDILHRLADRFPVHVLVWPVRVQGETAGAEVAAAIAGFNALAPGGAVPRPDLVIVARGGGSLEDLWGFNDEAVVRAAAGSAIPLISAVGHETDWTLIDHAADRRAPTPTAAAEFAVPVRADLLNGLEELEARRRRAMRRLIAEGRARIDILARGLPRREALFAAQRQRLDGLAERHRRWPGPALAGRGERLVHLGARLSLRPLARRMQTDRRRIAELHGRAARALTGVRREGARRERDAAARLARAIAGLLADRRGRLGGLSKLAGSLGPARVLARGYAMVRDGDGQVVRTTGAARAARAVAIAFADGEVGARIEGEPVRAPRPAPAARPKDPLGQGSLF